MKSAVIASLLILFVAASHAEDLCHLRNLDDCAASGSSHIKIPTTEQEIDRQCDHARGVIECVGNFTKVCASSLMREVIQMATTGARDVRDKYCTPGEKLRTDYLKHASCLAKAQVEGRQCVEDAKAGLQYVEKSKFSNRFQVACCVHARYTGCAEKIVENLCGKEAIEYANLLLEMATSNALQVVCRSFVNNPQCATLLPPVGTKTTINPDSISSRIFKTYFPL